MSLSRNIHGRGIGRTVLPSFVDCNAHDLLLIIQHIVFLLGIVPFYFSGGTLRLKKKLVIYDTSSIREPPKVS
jgi:hypothetical protein